MINVIEVVDKSGVYANLSKEIHGDAQHHLSSQSFIVFAGKRVYQELLAENESENLMNGSTEFRRRTALESKAALTIDMESLKAVKFTAFNI